MPPLPFVTVVIDRSTPPTSGWSPCTPLSTTQTRTPEPSEPPQAQSGETPCIGIAANSSRVCVLVIAPQAGTPGV